MNARRTALRAKMTIEHSMIVRSRALTVGSSVQHYQHTATVRLYTKTTHAHTYCISATIGSRPFAFKRAIDGVCTLPLTPQRVAQKANERESCCTLPNVFKVCTGWLKIKYPTRQYAISPQPVV